MNYDSDIRPETSDIGQKGRIVRRLNSDLLAEPAFAEAPALRKASGDGVSRRQASSLAGESRASDLQFLRG
jgi:hypothetical protein